MRIASFCCSTSSAPSSKPGASSTSTKFSCSASASSTLDRPVDRDHAAVGGDRVAGQRLAVGVERVLADRHPAGVVVLDDRAGGRLEVFVQPPRRVEVEHVVEGERLAVQLRHPGEDVAAHADLRVERRPLVRVLAVGEVELLLVGDRQVFGEVLVGGREPAADRGVVAGDVGEGLVGEPVAGRGRDLAAATPPARRRPRRRTPV